MLGEVRAKACRLDLRLKEKTILPKWLSLMSLKRTNLIVCGLRNAE